MNILSLIKQKIASRQWLIADWRKAQRFWMMRVNALGTVVACVKAGMIAASAGSGFLVSLHSAAAWMIVGTLFLVGMLARVLKQDI